MSKKIFFLFAGLLRLYKEKLGFFNGSWGRKTVLAILD